MSQIRHFFREEKFNLLVLAGVGVQSPKEEVRMSQMKPDKEIWFS